MNRRSSRIDTEGGDALGTNPFGELDGSGVPEGPKPRPEPKRGRTTPKPQKNGRVELRREKSGRGGKTVTTLTAFSTHLSVAEMKQLALDLKTNCACGGALKGRTIELQGDVRDRAMVELKERGFQPVRAGG